MAKIRLECLYCGTIWDDTVWDANHINVKCATCGEEKTIKIKEIKEDNANDPYDDEKDRK